MISNGEEPPLDTVSLDMASADMASADIASADIASANEASADTFSQNTAALPSPAPLAPEPLAEVRTSCWGRCISSPVSQLAHRAGILGWLLFLGAIGTQIAGMAMPMLLFIGCAAGLIGVLASLLLRALGPWEAREECRGILIYNAALFIPSLIWLGLTWRHLK